MQSPGQLFWPLIAFGNQNILVPHISLLLWVFNHRSRQCPCPEATRAWSLWGTCRRWWCCPAAHQMLLEDLPWGLHNGRTLQVPPHLAPLCKHFGNNQPWGVVRRRSLSHRGDGQCCLPVPARISTGLGHPLSYSAMGLHTRKTTSTACPSSRRRVTLSQQDIKLAGEGFPLVSPR